MPAIDRNQLWKDIHDTAQWGVGERWGDAPTDVGMARLSLGDADKQVRHWFIETTKALGCSVTVDAMGNIFAVRPGKRPGPPTMMGSHLDTQPAGGRYDGILGVLSGVTALRALHKDGLETEYPVGIVNWTNEEGARFPGPMMGSGVWAGITDIDTIYKTADINDPSVTVHSELTRIGFLGPTPAHYTATPMAAHFELHIEQGPILEASEQLIGIVEGIQACRWFSITVSGRESHTGATPFANRSDALLTAAKMIVRSHQVATQHGALASTGTLTVNPGSANTVPGSVTFSLDLRATEDDVTDQMEAELREEFYKIAADDEKSRSSVALSALAGTPGRGCSVTWTRITDAKVARFDPDCIESVQHGAHLALGPSVAAGLPRMYSGACHDSSYTATRVPTAMIFVPCRDGLTHIPCEYTSQENCATGAQVLLNSVLCYDKLRLEKATILEALEKA